MIVSLDGDILLYRVGFASEKDRLVATHKKTGKKYVGSNKTELVASLKQDKVRGEDITVKRQVKTDPLSWTLHSLKLQLDSIRESSGCSRIDIYLSGSQNFREKVSKLMPYKGSRMTPRAREALQKTGKYPYFFDMYSTPGKGRPKNYYDIKEYLISNWGAKVCEGMECDDKLTILQTKAWNTFKDLDKKRHVVASIDKDLQQVPGWYFDFRPEGQRKKGRPDWVAVTEWEARRNLWRQVLTGDRTDTIYGIEGMGDKRADDLLKDLETDFEMSVAVGIEYDKWFERVSENLDKGVEVKPVEKYLVENYKPREYMEEVYNLVYLLRDENEIQKWV